MKNVKTGVASALIALSLGAAVPAFAQQTTDGTTTGATTTTERVEVEDDRDFGWIGLLGLAGLLGLRRKPEVHRTTTTTGTNNNR